MQPTEQNTAEGGHQNLSDERAAQLLERVVTVYERAFAQHTDGREYLGRLGITDVRLFERHRFGYSNGNLHELLPENGSLTHELMAVGIMRDCKHERLAGCVIVPTCNSDGQLSNLCGLRIGSEIPEYIFLPGRPPGMWNSLAGKMYPHIIAVDSVIEALSVIMAGVSNVIAIPDASEFEIGRLRALGVQHVTLLSAQPGRLRPVLKAADLPMTERLPPEGGSLNHYLVLNGAKALAAWLAAPPAETPAPSALTSVHSSTDSGFLVIAGVRRYEIRGLEKGPRKLKATVRIEHAGKLHVDTVDLYAARARRNLAQDLCRLFDEMPETIEVDLQRLLRHCETLPEQLAITGPSEPKEPGLSDAERTEAEAFGKSPMLFDNILADFEVCGLVGERANKLLCYLAMTSRKLDSPLSLLILSSSGAGKTALQDAALAFCPPEDLVKLTSLSGKALFYKDRLSLRHKALALEEGAGIAAATYAIRNLITAQELVIESAMKDPGTGKITTMTNRVEGPTAVFITTTDPDTDAETRSRFFVTSVDESREQTRAILSLQRRRHSLLGLDDQPGIDAILRKHRNFQRLLRPLAVTNPYAERLTYGDDRLQGRRDQPKYLNLIQAVAFLRQMQKPIATSPQGLEYIAADLEDLKFANALASEILGRSLDELSTPGRELLLQIEAMITARVKDTPGECPTFTRRQVREYAGWAHARVQRYLKELSNYEYVLTESGRNGVTCRYRLAWDGSGKDGRRFVLGLMNVEDLA